jgi:MEMO1 family protein
LLNDAHGKEHSIEMELPLLQRALQPGWKLLPILVGQLDKEGFARVARQIRFLFDEDTLLVISGDFTHYGPNYDFLPFPEDNRTAENLRALDMGALARIAAGDAAGFIDYRTKTGITVCGFAPLALLLNLMPPQAQVHLLDYRTSGQLTGDYSNSVSYLAIAVNAKIPFSQVGQPTSATLSDDEMILLHRIARRALELATRNGLAAVSASRIALEFDIPDRLKQPSGAFVTLKKDGDLRGCIGFIKPIKPLYEAVIYNAVNAALRDQRFRAVQVGELAELEVEVSVLSAMRSVDSYREFKVGRHGIVLSKMGHSSVFLPEVAVEQGWNREQTLTHLARKAGLPGNGWQDNASFKLFTAQKFSAPYTESRNTRE